MNAYEAAWRALENELEVQLRDLERASREAAWESLQNAGAKDSPPGEIAARATRVAELQRRRSERAELLARMRTTLDLAMRTAR